MSMLRWARQHGCNDDVRLVVSVRTPDDLYYGEEIIGPETSVSTAALPLRASPWAGTDHRRRPARRHLSGCVAYVCGSASFADAATELLMDVGVTEGAIRVERFGPTAPPPPPPPR